MAPNSTTGKLAKLDNATLYPRIATSPDEYRSREKTYTGTIFTQDNSTALFTIYDPDKNEGLSLIEKIDKGGSNQIILSMYLDSGYNNLWWEGRMQWLSPATGQLPSTGKIAYSNDHNSLTITRGSEVILLSEYSPSNTSKVATILTGESTNNDPLNPTLLDWSGTSTPYQGKIEGTIGGSDKADYFVFKVLADQRVTGITLSSYTSTDSKAFIGLQKGAQVTATASNPGPLIGYTHFGNGNDDSVVGTNIISKLGGILTEGTYSIWVQQLGAKTDYSFIVDLEKVKNNFDSSVPTYNVSNTYAKNLVGDVLTGAPKLTQNSFDAKFYNLGGGRYGVQQKGKSTIDEITGVTSLQFQDQAISLANDVAATFNQVKGINDVSGVVFRLYNAAFARLPDANGLENWINGNKSGGQTYASSALEFSKSQEFKNRYGSNVSDTQYINTLYNNVLGRTPDPGGLSHYQGLLASGKDRGSLLLDFSESPENRQLFTKVTGLS